MLSMVSYILVSEQESSNPSVTILIVIENQRPNLDGLPEWRSLGGIRVLKPSVWRKDRHTSILHGIEARRVSASGSSRQNAGETYHLIKTNSSDSIPFMYFHLCASLNLTPKVSPSRSG